MSPELEKLRQQALNKPVYTGPIEIKLKSGSGYVDPRTPGALSGLAADASPYGSVTINGMSQPMGFQIGTVIALPRKSGCFGEFLGLYEAEISDQMSGSALLRLKLARAPIDKLEELLRGYNKGLPQDITSIAFSSLEAMQTFTLYLDMLLNNPEYLGGLSLNVALTPA